MNTSRPLTVSLYAPLRFEIPLRQQWATTSFGIGQGAAERLAKTLENDSSRFIIVFGSAGALREDLSIGQAFVVSSLKTDHFHEEIECPKALKNFPSASLWTSRHLIRSPEDKRKLHETSGSDLVDMEMAFLWRAAGPSLRSRLVFLRGIVDGAHDSLSFSNPLDLIRLSRQWPRYLNGISSFMDRVAQALHDDEDS